MSTKTEIIIEISPQGDVKLTTQGLKGTECENELKPIEKALGKVTDRKRTSEFYEKPVTVGTQNTTKTK